MTTVSRGIVVAFGHYLLTAVAGVSIFFACYGTNGQGFACQLSETAGHLVGFPLFTFVYPKEVEGYGWAIANRRRDRSLWLAAERACNPRIGHAGARGK